MPDEIGVRMAPGATRRDILALVLREAGSLVAVGLGIGNVLALGAASFARSLLFGLTPSDPLTIAAAAHGLATVAIAASFLPVHRAATLDPVRALREESQTSTFLPPSTEHRFQQLRMRNQTWIPSRRPLGSRDFSIS